jgi:hypothetical protein
MAQLLYTIVVVLDLPKTIAALIAYARAIVLKMTNNAYFATPSPALATVTAAITALEAVEASMATTKGLVGQRTAKKKALIALLKQLRDFVRITAENDPDNAAAIVASAGMRLKNIHLRVKALFTVTQGLSGSVICDVKSAGRPATYYWSFSLDQKTWTSAPDSLKSKVTISGLTVGQIYYFRYGYHDQAYVYAGSGRDASWEIMKRGILLAGLVGVVVAIVLVRVLGVRENAYTKGLSSLLKR